MANRALRDGQHELAIRLYVDALLTLPALAAIVAGNLDVARARYRRAQRTSPRLRVAVCGWELSHNAAGRVLTLAKMYGTFADVEIVGALFPDYGAEPWAPLGAVRERVHAIRVGNQAEFLAQALELVLAHPCDVVHLSKPRAPNIFFGLLYKLLWGARVIVDIDDDELAFVGNAQALDVDAYFHEHGRMPELERLDGALWTALAVAMAGRFDAVTVANPALQAQFGGDVVRHARDERQTTITPARRAVLRHELGLALDAKVVLFLGTPREHKGLLEVAVAIQSLGRGDVVFVVVGTFSDPELKAGLLEVAGIDVRLFDDQPLDKVHEYASIGDVCVLMQDTDSRVSRFQTPAKLSDALAAGMVVLATPVQGLLDLMQDGAAIGVTPGNLAATLCRVLDDGVYAAASVEAGRRAYLKHLSFAANVPVLRSLAFSMAPAAPDAVAASLCSSPFVAGTWLKQLWTTAQPSIPAHLRLPAVSTPPEPASTTVSGIRAARPATAPPATPKPAAAALAPATRPLALGPSAQAPTAPAPQRKLPITVLVVTWDVGHNPLGRSYMLAETLDRVARHVVIVGFQFPRYGEDLWEPVRQARLPVISLPGSNLPDFLDALDRAVDRIRPDVVVACKPRLPSLLFGLKLKRRWGCPLIVDVDDHELSFFKNRTPLTLDELAAMPGGSAVDAQEPFGELWTRLSETLCRHADEILVSNVALQRQFKGTLVPHVRDETLFDPSAHDRAQSRRRYGVDADAKVVLFFGTPRAHKGIDDLARAVGRMRSDARLVVVGSAPDRSVTAKLDELARGRVVYLPNQPFSDIPAVMAMADIVCLPQDEKHPISQYQLPAKAIDAVGMGIPLLVTRTPPLMQLVNDGVAVAVDSDRIAEELQAWLEDPARLADWGPATRARFLSHYSYRAAGECLRTVLQRATARRDRSLAPPPPVTLSPIIRRAVAGSTPALAPPAERVAGVDIVLFWKQNDTGIYGRRHDMVIKYLATRADVRRVVVFDAPLSEGDLTRWRDAAGPLTQDRLIYVKTYEKILGKLDQPKVRYNVFVHPPGKYAGPKAPEMLVDYTAFIDGVLRREGVQADRSVFWIYPKNFLAPALIDHFRPWKTVVDVVDDHRAWPGTSEEEKARLTTNYRELLVRADMTFVNCVPVQQSMSEFHRDVRLVPNGCDVDPPAVRPKRNAAFDAYMAWQGPTIGFIGNLEAKIDIELIEKVSRHFPEAQVVLIGSTHMNAGVLRLAELPNVKMPGVVPYEQIGAWLAKFDVALMPHLDTEMTRSMNPLKLYVYLVAGVPIVTTEVSNVALGSGVVQMAKSHDEFIAQTKNTLENRQQAIGKVSHYVLSNSWENRFIESVDELIIGATHDAKLSA
jgi:glycosyltransferase involved in cell wall biosynthesis